jgi:uncharacterized protein involved in type VI secretion and phage assembly
MLPFADSKHLRLETGRPKRSFEVLTCTGGEPFNRPYAYELEIVHPTGELDAHELLFSGAYLYAAGSATGIHGHIQSIMCSHTEPAPSNLATVRPKRYLITLGPRLGLMAFRHNQRIFQGMRADQIITQVLSEHGIDDGGYLWQRSRPCIERDFCAQYRESDLQLVQRLCGEEGMHYYFLHTRKRHVVVFTDRPAEGHEIPGEVQRILQPKAAPKPDPIKDAPMNMQRACVVGGLFEPVKPDGRGRLKVRFEWGNQGDGARFNDCWVPIDSALIDVNNPWWGGMEVVVNFRGSNPAYPYISHRLWDPDINPRVKPDPAVIPRRVITTRIDKDFFLDESQQFAIDDKLIIRLARNNELHFRVGSSLVTIDSKSLTLSGLKVMLSSIAQAEAQEQEGPASQL